MAWRKKHYEDDDGRTIADMGVLNNPKEKRFNDLVHPAWPNRPPEPEEKPYRAWEEDGKEFFSPEDRRLYVFAALRAALLIGLAFLAGLGGLIWFLSKLWA